jgi:hypothetical protein
MQPAYVASRHSARTLFAAVASIAALAALAAFDAAGCGGDDTGVRIEVSFTGIDTTQIEFAVFSGDHATTLVAPTLRPDPAAGASLATPQTVVVLLPNIAQTVICRARALSTPEVQGERTVAVRPSHVVALSIPLDGRRNGDSCGSRDECASGYCAGGRCCDSACDGTCVACDLDGAVGTCTAIAAGAKAAAGQCAVEDPSGCGSDGTCDGAGRCRRYPAGVACASGSCSGDALVLSSTCDGKGACVAGPTITCDPFLCDAGASRCFRSCMSNGQCVTGNVCNAAGSCGLKPLGADCAGTSECNGNAVCADGVCCSTACGGACMLCNVPGREGFCSPVPAAIPDPKGLCRDMGAGSCGTNGSCDGAGSCQNYAAGTPCPPPCGAAPGEYLTGTTCDGAGKCAGGTSKVCPKHFACNSADGTCFTACSSDQMCVTTCNTVPSPPRCRNN